MSRFLKNRHYSIIAAGVYFYIAACNSKHNVRVSTVNFLDATGISYTEEDVELSIIAFKHKYRIIHGVEYIE